MSERKRVLLPLEKEVAAEHILCRVWSGKVSIMFHSMWIEMSKMHFNQTRNEKQNIKYIHSLIHLDILLLSLSSSRSFGYSHSHHEKKRKEHSMTDIYDNKDDNMKRV